MPDITLFELDLLNPSALSPTQQVELEALANMPDGGIDYSDIPNNSTKEKLPHAGADEPQAHTSLCVK